VVIDFEDIPEEKNVIPENIEIEILYEDKDLIAVNKPEGMVVHPASGNASGTLVNALLYRYKHLKNVGDKIRTGLINRIDKDTSGIVLVGKTNRALWFYSRQFANREIEKTYLAVVKGDFSKRVHGNNQLKVSNYLARNPKNRTKFAVVAPGEGRLAISRFKLIDISIDRSYSLLEVNIETGRTHQIRVQLSALGYPVVGDKVYSNVKNNRLLLHAYKIKLTLLNGSYHEIEAQVRGELQKFLENNFNKMKIVQYSKPQSKNK